MRKVEVTWLDAWHEMGELTQKAIEDLRPIVRQSIGYLRKMTTEEVVIASGVIQKVPGGEDSFTDVSVLPRCMVKGILTLDSEDNGD